MEEGKRTRLEKTDALIAAGLLIAVVIALVATNSAYGMVWDEGFYYPTYRLVSEWFGLIFSDPALAFSSEGISAHWAEIRELPPVTKYIGALSTSVVPFVGPLLQMRFLFMVLFGGTISIAYLVARLLFPTASKGVCLVPALCYLLHPRMFAHGHVAASETVFAFITALSILIVLLDTKILTKSILITLIAVLACATKVNGIVLCIAIIGYYSLLFVMNYKRDNSQFTKKNALFVLLPILFFPLLLYAIWPWMWYETPSRLLDYWAFIRDHSHLPTWYLNDQYNSGDKLVPWSYPIVMTFVASPVGFLISICSGLFLYLKSLIRKEQEFDIRFLYVLLLIAGPYSSMMLTGAPKYDVLRLFLPAFFPLCLFATLMIQSLATRFPNQQTFLVGGFIVLLLAESASSMRVGLSYFNFPTRLATKTGAQFPFETAYWMESVQPEIFEWLLQDSGKSEVRVMTRAMHLQVLQIEQEWGLIPKGILINPDPPYDYHLIQNRRGFWSDVDWWLFANRENLLQDPLQPNDPRFFVFDGRPPYKQ